MRKIIFIISLWVLFLLMAGSAATGYAAPPTALDQTVYVETNAAVTITLKVTDDVDLNNLTFTLDEPPLKGTVAPYTGSNHSIKYTPLADDCANTYTFKYHVTDTGGQDSPQATVTLVVTKAVIIGAGPDQIDIPAIKSTSEPLSIQLEGSATDPDNYPGPLDVTWSIIRKPTGAIVEFDDINSPDTGVSFSQTGYYTLRLTVTDGAFTKADSVAIRVKGDSDADTPTNQPPVVKDQKARVRYTSNPYSIVLSADDPNEDPLTLEIISPPQHGSLTQVPSTHVYASSSFFIPYTPYSGYIGTDSFTFKVKDDSNPALESSVATMTLDIKPWEPPIGIPEPPLMGNGNMITVSHKMYEGQTFDYSQGGTVNDPRSIAQYGDTGNGPYTHYVDNTYDPNNDGIIDAIDNNNPYGAPAKPRLTIPINLPAGSVVEVQGGPYNSIRLTSWTGTSGKPIFVRGVNNPRFPQGFVLYNDVGGGGSYVIVENIAAYKFVVGKSYSYVALRHSDVKGDEISGGVGISADSVNYPINNIIIWNNTIHDNGIWDPQLAQGDKDVHGIAIGWNSKVSSVWVVDNLIYHNEGDGVQVEGGPIAPASNVNHIYVGRNVVHHNKQSGIWVKNAKDVIVSQNTITGMRQSSSAVGAGLGLQSNPQYVWFLFNKVTDSEVGAFMPHTSGTGSGNDHYLIGNIFSNIHTTINPHPVYTYRYGRAILTRNPATKYILNNVFHDVDGGYAASGTCPAVLQNNIFSNVSDYEVAIDSLSPGLSASNNLFSDTPQQIFGNQVSQFSCSDCLIGEPGFINPNQNDFHLTASSPARNAGDNTLIDQIAATFETLYSTPENPVSIRYDLDHISRPQGGRWDIGAYEYVQNEGEPTAGDINDDKAVNVLDVQACVNLILSSSYAANADLNSDHSVNVQDLQAIVNRILGGVR